MEEAQRYILNPSVQLTSLDLSGSQPRYLVEVDETRFEVSERLHQIIRFLQQGLQTAEEIARELRRSGLPHTSAESVRTVMRQMLIPRRIVRHGEDDDTTTAGAVRVRRSPLSWQIPIIKPETIRPLTGILQALFQRQLFTALLLVSAAAHIYFYALVFPGFQWSLMSLPAQDYLFLLVGLNLTTIFHELGHASACRFYNCPHGKIGWGLYLYMFVLYTDVTPAWKLRRKQRAMVDIGGMYFELIAAILLAALLLIRPSPFYVYFFVLLDLSIFHSFNPIIKRDGYWLLSDLIGVANLRDLSAETLRFWGGKLLGKERVGPKPRLFTLSRKLRITLYVYTALSGIFFFSLAYWLSAQVIREVIPGYPLALASFRLALGKLPVDYSGLFSASARLAFLTLFVALIGFTLFRLLRFAYRILWTLTQNRTIAASV